MDLRGIFIVRQVLLKFHSIQLVYILWTGEIFLLYLLLPGRVVRGRSGWGRGVVIEPREDVEGVGDGVLVGEGGRLLDFYRMLLSAGVAGMDWDLALSATLSFLLVQPTSPF